LIVIELEALKDQAKPLAEFLRESLAGSVQVKGSTIRIEAGRSRDVKLEVHKFLYHTGRNHYRVVTRAKVLTILSPKKPHARTRPSTTDAGAGISPFSPYRMNPMASVEFPNYPPVAARKFKRPKKK